MRIIFVLILLSVTAWASLAPAEPTTRERALQHAAEFLWSKQQANGSWRSDYYGVMRSGQSLTPFVLFAQMLHIDELSSAEAGRIRKATQFLLAHLDKQGALGRSDPDVLEYPVYSTSYAIETLRHILKYQKAWGPGPWDEIREARQRMIDFLAQAQYQEANGFEETHVAYGGWGFNAPVGKGVVGHMDIAHTRKALAALASTADEDELKQLRNRAELFLLLMQKDPRAKATQPHPVEVPEDKSSSHYDGGFYFSPVALSANKAPYDEKTHSWPSYASATCDGILALLAAGVSADDPRVVAATDWLRKHPEVDYPQGVPADHPEPWGDAIRFYHYAVRAEVYDKLSFPTEGKQRLLTAILKHQLPDGSFSNSDSPLMKEDDPLVCTSLAMIALAHCSMD